MATTIEVTLDDKVLENIMRLQTVMATEDPAEVFRRYVELADLAFRLEQEGYALVARRDGVPEKRIEIRHRPRFDLKLVPTGK